MALSKNEIKFIRSLQLKKVRDAEGLFIVEGIKLIEELCVQNSSEVDCIYCVEDTQLNSTGGAEIRIISQKDLERISAFKTPNHVLAVVKKKAELPLDFETEKMTLVLDDIKDPGNLGTIIRTSDWFGISQIICSPESVDCYNSKVIQATMGAIFRVNVFYQDLSSTIQSFSDNDFEILSAEMDGENAFEKTFIKKTLLIMGSESHGVSEEISTLCSKITIPKVGETESLNVSVAAGILCANYLKSTL